MEERTRREGTATEEGKEGGKEGLLKEEKRKREGRRDRSFRRRMEERGKEG